jgi:hypothetical protein
MSANPPDIGLSYGQTRIAQTELHQSARLALLRNQTSLITSKTIPLFCCRAI